MDITIENTSPHTDPEAPFAFYRDVLAFEVCHALRDLAGDLVRMRGEVR
ncbi:hypothetical protein [Plantactinospora sp. GCM10030261]